MRAKAIQTLLICGYLLSAVQARATDTLIENVHGYSWRNDGLHTFQAIRFDDSGRVLALYDSAPTENVNPAPLNRIDGNGATMLPGLIDAHGHVLSLGQARYRVDLVGTRTRAEAVERVAAFAKANPDEPWILGRGWNQELWAHNRFPEAADLDQIKDKRPVWLERIDGHAGWANTKAMKLAGINRRTADPHGGRILRDSKNKATGIFVDKASALIDKIVPAPTMAQNRRALLAALTELASVGLTSVHDAGIDQQTVKMYMELDKEGRLPIRVYAMLSEDTFPHFGAALTDDGTGFLAIQSVKAYLDGALGSRGAAMIEPYSDQPTDNGLLFKQTGELVALLNSAEQRGFQLNVHAIGDAANKVALDAFATLDSPSPLRHRIEHAQVIRVSDIPRFAKLGVIASMQTTHAGSDKNMAEDRIGADRLRGAYAWRRLLDSGAVLAGGSDFPIEPAEPLYGLHAAVTRQDRDNQPPGGWYSDQAMRLDEALRAFTLDAAYAAHQEKNLGSLEPGKRADFVLLDNNIFEIAPEQIWQTSVRETWVNGVCIYKAAH